MKKFGLKKCGVILALAAALAGCSSPEESSGYSYTPTPPKFYPNPSKPTVTVEASELMNQVIIKWSGENWDGNDKIMRFDLYGVPGNYNPRSFYRDNAYTPFLEGRNAVEYKTVLPSSGDYFFRVEMSYSDREINPYNFIKVSSNSVSYNFTYTPLSAPKNVKAERVSDSEVRISWDSTGAYAYKIYYSDPYAQKKQCGYIGPASYKIISKSFSWFLVTYTIPDQTYFYVTSCDDGGESPYSEGVSYTFKN